MRGKEKEMAKLSDPIMINKMELKNRFVAAPTVVCRATEQGYVNEAILQFYESQAKGGFGLVVVQGSFIREDGQSFEGQLGLYNERCGRSLGNLSYMIQRNGAKACIQLFHSGAIASPKRIEGREPVAPSSTPCFTDPSKMARELQEEEIWEIINSFARGAVWGKNAGFDSVQFHACHQSLIQQFLSWHHSINSSGFNSAFSFSVMHALTSSSVILISLTATTAHSLTAGCWHIAISTS